MRIAVLILFVCIRPGFGQRTNLLERAKQELDYIPNSKLGAEVVRWQDQISPLYDQWFNVAFKVRGGAIRIEQAVEKRRVKSEEDTTSSRYGDDSKTSDRKTEEEIERISTYVNVTPNRNVDGLRYWYDFNPRDVAQISGLLYRSDGTQLEVLSEWKLHQPNGVSVVFDEETVPIVIANYQKGKLDGYCCLFKDGHPYFAVLYRKGRVTDEYGFNGFHWKECTENKLDAVIEARSQLNNVIEQRLAPVFDTAWGQAGMVTKAKRRGRSLQFQSNQQLQNAQRNSAMGAAHARQRAGRP
jgi:hypothetical protein